MPATTPSSLLVDAFGNDAAAGIGPMVRKFKFSKIDVSNEKKKDYLTVGFAPSYGDLDAETVKAFDEPTKIMIAGVLRTLKKIPAAERNFDKLMELLVQSPLLENENGVTVRKDKITKQGKPKEEDETYDSGEPIDEEVQTDEVQDWFTDLVGDTTVLSEMRLDLNIITDIHKKTDSIFELFASLFKKQRYEKTLVDVGVLRFPTAEQPRFKLYHMKVTAWAQKHKVGVVTFADQSGVSGEFKSREFKPRLIVIGGLTGDARAKALAEAEAVFEAS